MNSFTATVSKPNNLNIIKKDEPDVKKRIVKILLDYNVSVDSIKQVLYEIIDIFHKTKEDLNITPTNGEIYINVAGNNTVIKTLPFMSENIPRVYDVKKENKILHSVMKEFDKTSTNNRMLSVDSSTHKYLFLPITVNGGKMFLDI